MSRMHSGGKGKSGSSRQHTSEAPAWSTTDKSEIEELIINLANDGHSTAMIGTILRARHGVPNVRLVTGERVSETLARNDISSRYPEDLMNIMRKALNLIDHLSSNPKDLHNRRQLALCESKIRRLSRYYIGTGRLPQDWVYKQDQLRLMVE